MSYKNGIFIPNKSSGVYVKEFYMLIVGYNEEENNSYYIYKFSFGTTFGELGYVNLSTRFNDIITAWSVCM